MCPAIVSYARDREVTLVEIMVREEFFLLAIKCCRSHGVVPWWSYRFTLASIPQAGQSSFASHSFVPLLTANLC
jgi:hypothetical protein